MRKLRHLEGSHLSAQSLIDSSKARLQMQARIQGLAITALGCLHHFLVAETKQLTEEGKD